MSLKLTKNLLTAKISEYLTVDTDDLHPFIIKIKNASETEEEGDAENTSIANGYIRWDALCQLFNKHFIPRNPKDDKPIFTMTCCQVINEDLPVNTSNPREGKHISPVLMAKVDDPLAGKVAAPPNSLDNSLDPTVCLLPLQNKSSLVNPRSTKLVYNFVLNGILPPFGESKLEEEVKAMANYTLTEDEKIHYIGHVYLNVLRLLQTYKSMKYTEDNVVNKEFYMWDYIKKIWDDVNDACGDTHDFKLTTDLERPNLVRVVDMRYQENVNIKQDDIITLNIQSTDSIVRDYSYNTSVPSAMSSTIAIAAQAPRNIDSLEAASFGAFHKHISNRFASLAKTDPKDIENEKTELAAIFDESHDTYRNGLRDLAKHQDDILAGNFLVVAEGGDVVRSEEIGKMKGLVSSVRRASEDLIQMYPVDSGGNFKGQPIPKTAAKPTSAIVPLKFNATLDGIGGIIIGNVFKLPKERLPKGYKEANIAFVVMGEDQDITSGQDWTTKITGQMIMLPTGGTGEDGWDGYDYNQYNETADASGQYNTDTKGKDTQAITDQQVIQDVGMNEIRVGDHVYLKMDTATHVRVSPIVDNESAGFGFDMDDNVIGMFGGIDVTDKQDKSYKGLHLGEVVEMTSTPIYVMGKDSNYYWANNDGTPNTLKGIVKKDDIPNDKWPWYKIGFTQAARDVFNSGWITQGDTDGDVDFNSADYGFNASFDEKKFAVENGYVSENNTLIRGWMRLDVLQSTKDYK